MERDPQSFSPILALRENPRLAVTKVRPVERHSLVLYGPIPKFLNDGNQFRFDMLLAAAVKKRAQEPSI